MIHHLYHLSLSKYYPFNSKLPNFSSRKMQLFFQCYFMTSITNQTNNKKERKPITSSLFFVCTLYYSSHCTSHYSSHWYNHNRSHYYPPLSSERIRLSSIPQSLLIFHTRHYLNLSAGSLSYYLLSSLEGKRSEVSLLGRLSQNPQSVIYST